MLPLLEICSAELIERLLKSIMFRFMSNAKSNRCFSKTQCKMFDTREKRVMIDVASLLIPGSFVEVNEFQQISGYGIEF